MVSGVSFDLGCEKVGIIGESGFGKSICGCVIMWFYFKKMCIMVECMVF